MKRAINHLIAIACFLLGLVFILVPGPSLIFFMAGLFLLSFYYVKAREYLKRCQRLFSTACHLLDKKLRH